MNLLRLVLAGGFVVELESALIHVVTDHLVTKNNTMMILSGSSSMGNLSTNY